MEGILTSFETRSGSLGASINSRIKQVGSKTAKTVHGKVKMTGVLEIDGYNLNVHRLTGATPFYIADDLIDKEAQNTAVYWRDVLPHTRVEICKDRLGDHAFGISLDLQGKLKTGRSRSGGDWANLNRGSYRWREPKQFISKSGGEGNRLDEKEGIENRRKEGNKD
ncbi:hypothetical protein PPACK8108_LOCUS4745 [Phakopsora pachyrhizi]|uniref:Uncharacterized protein n=1 Tax=Phakopsora pachyrhizi TaxID=170000 RepID=A0AAV0ANY2_PHAPC|nr:hypothetical protein PPACK8108_LOCUS4745 [Phakopsora pachyrhizi]